MTEEARETVQDPPSVPENDNDNDAELVERIRRTALGGSRDAKSRRSAQLAFDTSVDLDRRLRLIAELSAVDRPSRSRKKTSLGWLPIPIGILAVFALGAMLSKRASTPPKPKTEVSAPVDSAPQPADPQESASATTTADGSTAQARAGEPPRPAR